MLKVTQDRVVSTKIQYTTPYAPPKSSKAFNKKQLHPAKKQIASHDAIKLAMVWQLHRHAMQNIVTIIFSGSIPNMTLVLPKSLFHLRQFSSDQLGLQQLVSYVQFVVQLSDLGTQI